MGTTKIASPDDSQLKLFSALPEGSGAPALKTAATSGRRFLTGDPRGIVVGTTRLEEYLKQADQVDVFPVADLLDAQDWQPFEERYAATGRAPYAPRQMLGLILYGVMQGVHSLRELERMARLNLGCMWITGGITPDHAIIGRFIALHDASLSRQFFESITASILKVTGAKSTRLAGDGTVIEAACSHYNLLKREAIMARAEAAKIAAVASPDEAAVQKELEASAQCVDILQERERARKRSGRDTGTLRISPTEPEAMVQRLKRGKGKAASYKPSVLANQQRIITALQLHASSETKVVPAMLEQSARVVGTKPEELLLDAGYFDDGVIAETLKHDISLLCPEGKEPGAVKESALYHKSEFQYDERAENYRCPAGQILVLLKTSAATKTTRAFSLYGTSACSDCPNRSQCTRMKQRRIKRHPEDEQRDALRQVMQQRQVRKVFGQRKAMVEPVFSHLRAQQGLTRFRRRGLAAVTREFALHAIAYNLSRAVALLRAIFYYFLLIPDAIQAVTRRFPEDLARFILSDLIRTRRIRNIRRLN